MIWKIFWILILTCTIGLTSGYACSVIYFVDKDTGKIYVANNEDYWYDVKAYIRILPKSRDKLARLWYGWDNFAQGGINEAGLFFDGAVSPKQRIPEGYGSPNGNLGDDILSKCKTVDEAIVYLEDRKIALDNAHIMFGDRFGNAKIVEWVNGERKIVSIDNNRLVMTNFNLSDTPYDKISCPRYKAIDKELDRLGSINDSLGLKEIGNAVAKAVQIPSKDENGREAGTLYSTFINITDMEFVLVYKIDNSKIRKLNLQDEFKIGKKKKIPLD